MWRCCGEGFSLGLLYVSGSLLDCDNVSSFNDFFLLVCMAYRYIKYGLIPHDYAK